MVQQDMKNALSTFRLIAPEFSGLKDREVRSMLELCEPLISKRRFGRVYTQALALLAAHRLKLAGKGTNIVGGSSIGGAGATAGFGLASVSEGDASVSFNNANVNTDDDSWYALTPYGMEFLNLRRIFVVSIVSSGER